MSPIRVLNGPSIVSTSCLGRCTNAHKPHHPIPSVDLSPDNVDSIYHLNGATDTFTDVQGATATLKFYGVRFSSSPS
jgi:hypothetical protein